MTSIHFIVIPICRRRRRPRLSYMYSNMYLPLRVFVRGNSTRPLTRSRFDRRRLLFVQQTIDRWPWV